MDKSVVGAGGVGKSALEYIIDYSGMARNLAARAQAKESILKSSSS